MENNNLICQKEYCTGCYACVNVCPKGCISMRSDDDLCIRPFIDNTKCVNCKLCRKICPSLNNVRLSTPKKAYAAFSKDLKTNIASTSGGVAAEISRYIIDINGIVYASAMKDDLTVSFIRCSSYDDLSKIQGSKYVHSHMNFIYKSILDDLKNNLTVLFIGTPCQVAGVYAYIGSSFDNLYTIDVVCHGVPAQKVFADYSEYELKSDFSKAKNVTFRDKNNYILKYYDENKNELRNINNKCSYFFTAFLDGICQRENCYHCLYAKKERIGDITLGDFWGLGDDIPSNMRNINGTNVVLVNSDKGSSLLEKIQDKIEICERTVEEAIKGNTQLNAPLENTKEAELFRELCKKESTIFALTHYNNKKRIFINLRKYVYNHKILFKILSKFPIIKNRI